MVIGMSEEEVSASVVHLVVDVRDLDQLSHVGEDRSVVPDLDRFGLKNRVYQHFVVPETQDLVNRISQVPISSLNQFNSRINILDVHSSHDIVLPSSSPRHRKQQRSISRTVIHHVTQSSIPPYLLDIVVDV